jgi:arginyl-tRNA synthetase
VLGDALSALFETQGFDVTREFYYNDAGVQIITLANSVLARANGLKPGDPEWPNPAYNGDYIADISRDFLAQKKIYPNKNEDIADIESVREFAVNYLRREQDLDLISLGIKFDNYYLESSLYSEGKVSEIVDTLNSSGATYKMDGALWLRTTDYGDDKDRVMRKSDGSYTYFIPDVAYHVTKWRRGFSKAINIQGSDHFGTTTRVRAGLQALNSGIPKNYPEYVLHKMVRVIKNSKEVKISKRAGSYVTLRDLIRWSSNVADNSYSDAIDPQVLTRGRDAVRFFLISRKADTEFLFDVDLALTKSDENPVYYIQYAHARICSLLVKWDGNEDILSKADLSPLNSEREARLLIKLGEYPETLQHALNELAPHQVAFYLRDLASELHSYYNAERILVDDKLLRIARLALLYATRQVLRNGLALIGVSTPVHM